MSLARRLSHSHGDSWSRLHCLITISLAILTAGCTKIPTSAPDQKYGEGLSASSETTVLLTQEDFESTPLGGEPYPFIAETWCTDSFIGASEEVAHSGSRSFKYNHSCAPGTQATITTLSFALCTRWPTSAHIVLFRRHDAYGISHFDLHSGVESQEPRTAVILYGDGGIYVSDGVGPNILVGQYQLGDWTKFETMWDFEGGSFDLLIDNVPVGSFPTYVKKAFWLGFGTGQPGTTFYDDDVRVTLDLRGERQNCDGTEPLPWPWPPEEGQLGG